MSKNNSVKYKKISIYVTWPLYLSVFLLLLNDYILKQAFPGMLSGKLSDFSGIFLMILVLREVFPHYERRTSLAVILFFIFWKSSFSQQIIDTLNAYAPLHIGRVVDYTDLFALAVVPIANYVFNTKHLYQIHFNAINLLKIPAIIITVLAITGTSTNFIFNKYTIRKEEADKKIDAAKAIYIINEIATSYGLTCGKCDLTNRKNTFKKHDFGISYSILENNNGIEFIMTGNTGGMFDSGHVPEMDEIKRKLQQSLEAEFKNMEFVIKLPVDKFYNDKININAIKNKDIH